MPHKHTRRDKDLSAFDLPPTEVAKPLPVTLASRKSSAQKKPNTLVKKPAKRKRKDGTDDTPRAFKRLMAFAGGKKPRPGLDDGIKPGKKAQIAKRPVSNDKPSPDLAIRPGERLSEYSQRVDAALPLSGLVNKLKNGKDPVGLKVWQTAKERRMQNMYSEWREMDRRLKEKREEEQELAEGQEMEQDIHSVTSKMKTEVVQGGKKRTKAKRQRYIGEAADEEDDPWEELKYKRGERKVGLHDVVKAPPDLKMVRTKTFVQGAAVVVGDIPKSAGSLRQREHLQEARNEVVASYRKMMAAKRQRSN